MHFEILVEDQSGKRALKILVPKIIGTKHTFTIRSYKGIGRIPKNLNEKKDPQKCYLLTQLPQLLEGFGNTFKVSPYKCGAAVIVVCDLDKKCLKAFRKELFSVLNNCNHKPITRFCIAIEEGEAWFLGDCQAIIKAYPNAQVDVLKKYKQDSICGTWEALADAVYKGGSKSLSRKGWQAVGKEKSQWAEKISPCMDVFNNASPSFVYFRKKLLEFV